MKTRKHLAIRQAGLLLFLGCFVYYILFLSLGMEYGIKRAITLKHFFLDIIQRDSNGTETGQLNRTEVLYHRQSSVTPMTNAAAGIGRIINPHDYKYIINEPRACTQSVVLVIVVCTGVKRYLQRNTIRDTWGMVARNGSMVRLVFFLGKPEMQSLQAQISKESNLYRDIIQEDFLDTYKNLSLKSVGMVKWASTFCKMSKFVLKADDDMYINVQLLLTVINGKYNHYSRFIMGFVFDHVKPIHNNKSKWYTPKKDFLEMEYPKYCSGTSYLLSGTVVPMLYNASLYVKLFWLEDVYLTGILAREVKIDIIHNSQFSFLKRPNDGCAYKNAITGHRVTIANMHKIHRELTSPELKC